MWVNSLCILHWNWNILHYISTGICYTLTYKRKTWKQCLEPPPPTSILPIFHHECEMWLCIVCAHVVTLYSQVCKENRWVGTVRLDVLHGVPLVDTGLVGWDSALVVADPGQEQAAWVVVMATSHFACFVERLKGWPEADNMKEQHLLERLT